MPAARVHGSALSVCWFRGHRASDHRLERSIPSLSRAGSPEDWGACHTGTVYRRRRRPRCSQVTGATHGVGAMAACGVAGAAVGDATAAELACLFFS